MISSQAGRKRNGCTVPCQAITMPFPRSAICATMLAATCAPTVMMFAAPAESTRPTRSAKADSFAVLDIHGNVLRHLPLRSVYPLVDKGLVAAAKSA